MTRQHLILRALGDLLLPRRCAVCGRELSFHEEHLCIYCRADFPYTGFWNLRENPMTEKFNAAISTYFPENEPFDNACALFFYTHESDYRYITMDLKYHGALKSGRYFARELGVRIAGCDWFADLDLLVPVPLHPMRKWKRGYNQAEVIARGVSSTCRSIPVAASLLRRTRRTKTQTALSVEEKKANVEGVFAVNEKVLAEFIGRHGSLPGHIAIVDDVFTTGATVTQCWKALRAKLPPSVKISVITLAFVQ